MCARVCLDSSVPPCLRGGVHIRVRACAPACACEGARVSVCMFVLLYGSLVIISMFMCSLCLIILMKK